MHAQVGLALVDVYSEALLMARDVLEAFQVVQGMAALTHDASHLLAVAGVKFSALDDQHLSSLRAQAQAQVGIAKGAVPRGLCQVTVILFRI